MFHPTCTWFLVYQQDFPILAFDGSSRVAPCLLDPDCNFHGDLMKVPAGLLVEKLYQQGGSYASLRLPSFSSPKRLSDV